jgi:hypothetical protein
MPLKKIQPLVHTDDDVPAPLSSAGLSRETIDALKRSAKQLKDVPARAFSKREIEQVFKKIRDRS